MIPPGLPLDLDCVDSHSSRVPTDLTIFLSYSRSDMALADRLVAALETRGFRCLIDRRDLEYGEKWQGVLRDFIAEADTIIFLVSPKSIDSQWCRWEVAEVARLAKRMIPIVIEFVPPNQLPPEISDWHLMPLDPSSDFETQVDRVAKALVTDREWVLEHTRLGALASAWERDSRHRDRLLQGAALAAAETWKSRPRKKNLRPDALIEAYISESRGDASRRARQRMQVAWSITAVALALAATALWQSYRASTSEKVAQANERQAQAALAAEKEARAAEAARLKEIDEIAQLADKYPNFRIPTFGTYDSKHTAWIELSMPQEAQEFEYSALVYSENLIVTSDYGSVPYLSKGSFTPLNRGIILRGHRARFQVCATYYDVASNVYILYRREFLEDERVPRSVGTDHGKTQPALPISIPHIESSASRLSCTAMIEQSGVAKDKLQEPEWRRTPPLSRGKAVAPADRAKALLSSQPSETQPEDPNRGTAERAKALFAGHVDLGLAIWKAQRDEAHALVTISSSADAEDLTYAVRIVDENGREKKWDGVIANLAKNEYFTPTGEDGTNANRIESGRLGAKACITYRDRQTRLYAKKSWFLARDSGQVERQSADTTPMGLVQIAPTQITSSSDALRCVADDIAGDLRPAPSATPRSENIGSPSETETGTLEPANNQWDHNGSVMQLIMSDSQVMISYDVPRPGIANVGVQRNTLLFNGILVGTKVSGTARIFSRHCPPAPYQVQGEFSADRSRLVLDGRAPRVDRNCNINSHKDDQLVFQLKR